MVENGLHNLLSTAFNRIISHILDHGDGLLGHGVFSWTESNAAASLASGGAYSGDSSSASTSGGPPPTESAIHIWNANNHQVTYGVLGVVFTSMIEFMQANGWGAAKFEIWDGGNIVGGGTIG